MREILFRGKRKDNGEWVEGLPFYNGEEIIDGIESKDGKLYYVIPESVSEFTGLLDNNGQKIFEGDIVYSPYEDENAVIKWDDDDAMFTIVCDDICTDFSHYWGHDLEVIGNIHDNPELIESRW